MEDTSVVLTAGHGGHSTSGITRVSIGKFASFSITAPFPPGRREIQDIPIYCENKGRGCKWEVALGALGGHMTTCGFTLVPCPKKCEGEDEEIKSFLRKDLANHLKKDCPNRDYECELCGEEGTYWYITEYHDDECDKKVVPCPNAGCCEVMPREDLDDHYSYECEYEIVSCKYENIGCGVEMVRRNMATHEQDNALHLQIAIGAVVKLQDTVEDLKDRLERTEHHLCCVDSIKTFALHGYQNKKENNERFV